MLFSHSNSSPLSSSNSSYNFATMSGLKPIMEKLKATFDKYASQDGDKNTVSKKEVRALLSKEMLGETIEKEEAGFYLELLDNDGDGVLNFKEFVIFMAGLVAAAGDD